MKKEWEFKKYPIHWLVATKLRAMIFALILVVFVCSIVLGIGYSLVN